MAGNLQDVTYGINFELDGSGITTIKQAEADIDAGLMKAGASANNVDVSLIKAGASAQKAGQNAKPLGDELDKANQKGKGTDSTVKTLGDRIKEAGARAKIIGDGFKSAESKVQGLGSKISGVLSGIKNTVIGIGVAAAGGFGLFKLTDSAVNAGDSTYKLSQRLHLTATEASSLNKIFSVTGSDISPFISTMTRMDKSLETAGKNGNSTTQALAAFHITLTDASGGLLPMNQQLDALAAGYKKAADAGMEEEYAATVLGSKGQQLIPVLEDYADAKAAASQIKGIGIDPEMAHKTKQELTVMKAQFKQFGLVGANALMPIAQKVIPLLTDKFIMLAGYIGNHKEDIKNVAKEINNMIDGIKTNVFPIFEGVFKDIFDTAKQFLPQTKDKISDVTDIIHSMNDALKWVGEHKGEIKDAIEILGGAWLAYKLVVDGIALAQSLVLLTDPFALAGMAIIAIALNWGKVSQAIQDAYGWLQKFTGTDANHSEIKKDLDDRKNNSVTTNLQNSGDLMREMRGQSNPDTVKKWNNASDEMRKRRGETAKAAGTRNFMGGDMLAGEYGPEIISGVPKGGQVITANETQNIFNKTNTYVPTKSKGDINIQSQLPNINIYVNASDNPKDTAIEVNSKLEQTVKRIFDENYQMLTVQLGYGK